MKNNKTMIYVGVGLAVAVVGFFAYRMIKNKSKREDAGVITEDVESTVITTSPASVETTAEKKPVVTGNLFVDLGNTINNLVSNFKSYKVSTTSGNLNVRQKPDSVSKIVGSLKKDSVIKAKPSGTTGWFAVTDDGNNIRGYVSSTYLKLQ